MIVLAVLMLVAGVSMLFLARLAGKERAETGTPPTRKVALAMAIQSLILWFLATLQAWINRSGQYGEVYVFLLAAAAFLGNAAMAFRQLGRARGKMGVTNVK